MGLPEYGDAAGSRRVCKFAVKGGQAGAMAVGEFEVTGVVRRQPVRPRELAGARDTGAGLFVVG